MTATTAEQMRAWTGAAILTCGCRPFFLGAAVRAALAIGREIVAGRNWRNLRVAGIQVVFIIGNALCHRGSAGWPSCA